jgi:hypothetical protein
MGPVDVLAPAAAGALGGMCTDFTFLPFDTLRARLNYLQSSARLSANPLTAMRQASAQMVAAEGPFSLFRGASAVLLFCAPTYGAYFGVYKVVSTHIERRFGGAERTPGWAYLVGGLMAEVGALWLFLPYDVTKQRLQCAPASSRISVFGLLRQILAESGIGGLYRGGSAALATYIPFSGIYFGSYETFKRLLLRAIWPADGGSRGREGEGASATAMHAVHFASAVSAGTVGAWLTHPIDVIKTRIQVGDLEHSGKYERTMLGTLRNAVAQGGLRGLFRGSFARVLAIAPGCGCSMTIFETALPLFSAFFRER